MLSILMATGASSRSASSNEHALPSPWQDMDIGDVKAPGSSSWTAGTFHEKSTGGDIWGTADAMHYIYRRIAGNGQITARVVSVQYTDAWSKAGVDLRASLIPSSQHYMVMVTPANGVEMQGRQQDGADSFRLHGITMTAPYWVRITRAKGSITGSISEDGVDWTPIGRAVDALPHVAYVGLALTAHNNAYWCNARFDHVTLKSQ
jgi:hypothetical protein